MLLIVTFMVATPTPANANMQPSFQKYSFFFSVAKSADISPLSIKTSIEVAQDGTPFGDFATPQEGETIRSSVAITGWALDDEELSGVDIFYRKGSLLRYIGSASFVEGARDDVFSFFPDFTNITAPGWGYMLLSNFLPEGDGKYTLVAVATDNHGNQSVLGEKTVLVDNQNAVKPFGAIDTPLQGGTASGTSYRNHGWTLTPGNGAVLPTGIDVYIDGNFVGKARTGIPRTDIAEFFPGKINSNKAGAFIDIDTTKHEDGIHEIYWIVYDDLDNVDGIGSRFFQIQNDVDSTKKVTEE